MTLFPNEDASVARMPRGAGFPPVSPVSRVLNDPRPIIVGRTPFAEGGQRLAALGYSPIPIMPDAKVPGILTGDGWRFFGGWSQYCDKTPGPFQVRAWSAWDRAGLGVCGGRGLVGIDVDRDEFLDEIKAALPPTPVAKKGRKGETLFFRADTNKIRSRGFKIDGVGVLDIISHGKQTVLPPSIHPATGLPYEWTTEKTLLDTKLADLPEFTEEHFEAILDILRRHGWDAAPTFEFSGEAVESDGDALARDFFRTLNEDALANLDAWVPKLGLYNFRREPDGSYRAVTHWRPSSTGQPVHRRSRNLSLDRRGIKDFGDGDKGYTPLNVVMRVHDLATWQVSQAAVWLGEALGMDFRPKIILRPKSAPTVAPEPEGTDLPAEASTPVMVRSEPASEVEEDGAAFHSSSTLDQLASPPGLVGEIIDWITSTTERPSRAVALGPALGLVGTLAGRLYASPSDLRTNLYIVTLAPSGYGKDRPREAIKRIVQAGSLKPYLGAGRLMSTTALRNSLMRNPTCLYMLDEFHGTLRLVLDKRNSYGQLLGTDLMEVFASASTFFAGAEYASTPAVDIYNPNLSVYGTSTQDAFWGSVSSASALDGLLARFILLNIDGPKPVEVEPSGSIQVVPPNLIERCQAVASSRGNLAKLHDGSAGVLATTAHYSGAAEERLRAFKRLLEAKEARADSRQLPFLNRSAEHAIKLALTVAVGCNPKEPQITDEAMEWAINLSWHSTASMISETRDRVADSQREADYNKIIAIVRSAGENGIKPSAIPDRTRGMDERRRVELLKELEWGGRIHLASVATKRGNRPRYVFVR